MVDDKQLTSVLSEFALTLATDFSISSILDHLVQRMVEILPVTSAGVTLIDAQHSPRYVAASDAAALRYEGLQSDLGEGPCLLAYHSGSPVAVPDLRVEERFPQFASSAIAEGMAAVFTFPLHHGDHRLGALDLYSTTPGGLDDSATDAALTLANVAAAYLINAQAREDAHTSSDRMRHIATHDELTGLPNRMLLLQRIEHAAKRARRSKAPSAVLFVDLDQFKRVNDTHGHEAGDELLRRVADRLRTTVRPGDTLARIYGDEFVLLCEDLRDQADVEMLVNRVSGAFVDPFDIGDVKVRIDASVGASFAGPGEPLNAEMVARADRSMYEAKRATGEHFLEGQRDGWGERSSGLDRDLPVAVERGDLRVAFQPIVGCPDGRVTGVEALLRWTHPDSGVVPASLLVAVAERTGMIGRIGAWVLDRSCREAVRWASEHPEIPLEVAVNISTYQLMAPNFVPEVAEALRRTGLPVAQLVLEVTENVLIEDSDLARSVLTDLKGLGVRIALDDFGTGYSSLSYLHELPIDTVKIDRSFLTGDRVRGRSIAIVAAVTDLAHALELDVIVEGVETEEQRRTAIEVGADQAQGYFYSRPVPAQGIDELLAAAPGGLLTLPVTLAP